MNAREYRAHIYLAGIAAATERVVKDREELAGLYGLKQTKDLTAERVQTSELSNPTEQAALQVIGAREELETEIADLISYRSEARRIIGSASLTATEYRIIYTRYFPPFEGEGRPMTWEQIADKYGYSLAQTFRIRNSALDKIAALVPER